MTTMLEKAAEEAWLEVQQGVPGNVRLVDWAFVSEDAKNNFRRFVRAVLLAIRDPDETMCDAMIGSGTLHYSDLQPPDAKAAWQAGIDAILEEKPE